MRGAWIGLIALICGACDDGDPMGDPGMPGADARTDQRVVDMGPPSLCVAQALAAQCPIGSAPQIIESGCVEGAEITDANGQTTGVCVRAGECLFVCNFTDPCPCGIDSISADRIVCTDCRDAAACGDAICDRGESSETCAVDCGERCVPANERCDGNARQECEDTGRWTTLACRDDQICQFGQAGRDVVTVCQTRISQSGGTFVGLGAATVGAGASADIRFQAQSFDGMGLRFIEGGARVLAERDGRLVLVDPSGMQDEVITPIDVGDTIVASERRVGFARQGARWPQLAEPFDETTRTVEVMVHDGAQARRGGMAISADGSRFAVAYAVGLDGADRLEPVLGVWDDAAQITHLLRYVDDAVVLSDAPAGAVALSEDGAMAAEARQDQIMIIWNVAERRFVHLIQTDVGEVTRLAMSTAGDDLVLVGGSAGVSLWDLSPADGDQPTRRWRIDLPGVQAVGIAPSSDVVVVVRNGSALILDAANAEERFSIRLRETVRHVDFDPNGGRLLLGNVIYSAEL